MLTPAHLRDLLVNPRLHPRGQPHLSAASGLVRVQEWLYVVADDEHHLGVFDGSAPGDAPGTLLRLLEGDLPYGKRQRKAVKPDLETLTALPPMTGYPHGALLALGSGSQANRQTGVLLALGASGATTGRVAHLDVSTLYAPLRLQFADLNIEGAFVSSGELHLLQRGNQGDARNACIHYAWNHISPWLAGQRSAPPAAKSVQIIDLGEVGDVPLSLTDGAALSGGGWVFSAVAEDTHNSYRDGACVGSAVGVVGPDGQIRQLHTLQGAPKVEGIAVQVRGDERVLTLVTDADDPAMASQVLQVTITIA